MCLQVNLDAEFVLSNLDAARWHTSPLVKQGLASDRDLPGGTPYLQTNLIFQLNSALRYVQQKVYYFVLDFPAYL